MRGQQQQYSRPANWVQQVPDGAAGTREVLKHMRELVRAGKLNPNLRDFAQQLIAGVPAKDWQGEVAACFDFVRDEIRYSLDTNGIEVIQAPDVTLRLGYGDCDDKVTLLCCLLELCGHVTWFCAMGFDAPGDYSHVIAICCPAGDQPLVALDATEWRPMGWFPPNPTCVMIAEM